MTYSICIKLIESKRKTLSGEEWERFTEEIKNKLDIFLLANRMTDSQYRELIGMIS